MYKYDFKYNRNDVPFITRKEMNSLAEIYLSEAQPSALKQPEEVDIDSMIEFYLGCTIEYQYLSHNQMYLGLAVFNSQYIQIYNPETARAEDYWVEGNTIVFDSTLCEQMEEHRYRFTAAHEFSHMCMHRRFFNQDNNQISFLDENIAPLYHRCHRDIEKANFNGNPKSTWTDIDTIEWQANNLGAAILMPVSMVYELADSYKDKKRLIRKMSKIFNVSKESAFYRAVSLNFVDNNEEQLYLEGSDVY